MDDIASELGISKKTLYQHFENKYDVVLKVTQHEIKSEFDELDKICDLQTNAISQLLVVSKSVISKLHNLNSSLLYDMNKYYPEIWGKLNNQRKEYLLALIQRNFQIGMKQGIYRSNLKPESINVFYTFLFDFKGFELYKDVLNSDFDKMFDFIFIYHVREFVNKEEVEYLEKQFKN